MPASNTITAWNVFQPDTLIRSANVNTNFDTFRGHLLPIETGNTAAAMDATYDIGSSDYQFKDLYISGEIFIGGSTYTSYEIAQKGTPATPETITSAINLTLGSANEFHFWTVGDTASTIINTGTAQLPTPNHIGQKITIFGTSDSKYWTMRADADNVYLNGDCQLYNKNSITLIGATSYWYEIARSN